jgi:hypothetical protein
MTARLYCGCATSTPIRRLLQQGLIAWGSFQLKESVLATDRIGVVKAPAPSA